MFSLRTCIVRYEKARSAPKVHFTLGNAFLLRISVCSKQCHTLRRDSSEPLLVTNPYIFRQHDYSHRMYFNSNFLYHIWRRSLAFIAEHIKPDRGGMFVTAVRNRPLFTNATKIGEISFGIRLEKRKCTNEKESQILVRVCKRNTS